MYRAKIEQEGSDHDLLEFKVFSPSEGKKRVFKKGSFHCGWFLLEGDKLVGPILIDTELIKQGRRVIKDKDFPNLQGKELKSVCKEGLLDKQQTLRFVPFLTSCLE